MIHSQVGKGNGTALEFLGSQFVSLGSLTQVFDLGRDSSQSLGVSIFDDRSDQTSWGSNSDRNINIVVGSDDTLFTQPSGVDFRNSQ